LLTTDGAVANNPVDDDDDEEEEDVDVFAFVAVLEEEEEKEEVEKPTAVLEYLSAATARIPVVVVVVEQNKRNKFRSGLVLLFWVFVGKLVIYREKQ
jgi:hypothetical protein